VVALDKKQDEAIAQANTLELQAGLARDGIYSAASQ
jgi:hypothetical protein